MLIVYYGKHLSLSLPHLLPLSFFDRSSPKSTLCKAECKAVCNASCPKQCSCSWDVGQQQIWNVTVTVENPLGKKTATDVFDVNHRSKGFFYVFVQCFFLLLLSLILLYHGLKYGSPQFLSSQFSYLPIPVLQLPALASVSALKSCLNSRKQLYSKGQIWLLEWPLNVSKSAALLKLVNRRESKDIK